MPGPVAPLQTGLPGMEPPRPGEWQGALSAKFVVPPFTILDTRAGYWQQRKRAWLSLGMKGDLGRENHHAEGIPTLQNQGSLPNSHVLASERGRDVKNERPGQSANRYHLGATGVTASDKEQRERDARVFASDKGRDVIEGSHMMCGKNSAYRPIGVSKEEWNAGLDAEATAEMGRVSIFDPVLAEILYRWFTPKGGLILDPLAGGSVRGIVAAYLGRQYVGIDLNGRQLEENRRQAEAILGPGHEPYPLWIEGDALEVVPSLAGSHEFDAFLTCPPYGDLEVYSDSPQDLSTMPHEAFCEAYRKVIAASCALLRPDRFAAIVVGDYRDARGHYRNFVSLTIDAFLQAGLFFYNEAIQVLATASDALRAGRQFQPGRKLVKGHANVLVFVKGDWKKAAQNVGPIDVATEDMQAASNGTTDEPLDVPVWPPEVGPSVQIAGERATPPVADDTAQGQLPLF